MTDTLVVVGLGSMGKRRVRDLISLGVERVIGVDRREDRRAEVEQRFHVATMESFEAALAEHPKAVIISVPPHLHYKLAVRSLEAGAAYFVECLTALTNEEMHDLVRREKTSPGHAFPSCTHLFLGSTQHTQKLLREGSTGRVYSILVDLSCWLPNQHPWEKQLGDHYEFHRAQGGGLAEPAYQLSWIFNVLGKKPVAVVAKAAHLSDLPPGFNDLLDMIIELDGGTVLNMHYSLHEQHDGSIGNSQRFACARGTIVSQPRESRFYDASTRQWIEWRVPEGWSFESVYLAEMQHFRAALDGRVNYQGSLAIEQQVLATLLAAEESAQTGRSVKIEIR